MKAHGATETSVKQRRRAVSSRLAKVLYVASALRIRPRGIDRYIDYFGDGLFGLTSQRALCGVSLGAGTVAVRRRVS